MADEDDEEDSDGVFDLTRSHAGRGVLDSIFDSPSSAVNVQTGTNAFGSDQQLQPSSATGSSSDPRRRTGSSALANALIAPAAALGSVSLGLVWMIAHIPPPTDLWGDRVYGINPYYAANLHTLPSPAQTKADLCVSRDQIGLRELCESPSSSVEISKSGSYTVKVNGARAYTTTLNGIYITSKSAGKDILEGCSVPKGTLIIINSITPNTARLNSPFDVWGTMPQPPIGCGRFAGKTVAFGNGRLATLDYQ